MIEPQAAPTPAPFELPCLYVQLMQDVTEDPSVREESHGSSPMVQE
jgi:hypothetical protein